MDIIKIECTEISEMDGYAVVRFSMVSLDGTIYAEGNFGIQIGSSAGFEPGKQYGLDLKETD